MGIRRVGTPQEEKETYRARQAGIRKRARARAKALKEAKAATQGSMINRGKLSKKEWDKIEAAKKRGAAALKRAKAVHKKRVKKASTRVVKKSKGYA